jgi:PadR family transcriptional regulator, regulatory protein PadR
VGENDVWQGTLALMVLKTLESMGPLHGYGIARRIEQTSGDRLIVQYGTLFYKLTRAGRRQVEKESQRWEKATAILARFVSPGEEPL